MSELINKHDWFANRLLGLQTGVFSLWYANHTFVLQTRRLNYKQLPVCKRVSMVCRQNWLVYKPNLSSVSDFQTDLFCKQEVLVFKPDTTSFSGLRTELVSSLPRPGTCSRLFMKSSFCSFRAAASVWLVLAAAEGEDMFDVTGTKDFVDWFANKSDDFDLAKTTRLQTSHAWFAYYHRPRKLSMVCKLSTGLQT